MKSNPSSVFGLATILAFLTFPVFAQTPAGVPSLDEMAGDWLPMKDVANPPDVNNFHDMLIINRDMTSFFCNPEDWLWGWGDGKWSAGYPLVTLTIAGKEYPATEGISGTAFSDVVINTFFGFAPSLDGKNLLADPQTPRPFTGKLIHISARGEKFTISAGSSGVEWAKEQ